MRISRKYAVSKCEDLLELASVTDGDIRDEVMQDYAVHILALKSINDSYPDEQLLKLTSKLFDIGDRFPIMTVEEIEECMVLCEVLQVLSENVLTL